MPIFELCRAILVKSHVWKFGSDWLSLSRESKVFEFSVGAKKNPIMGGYMWPAMPIFELVRAIPVKSHVWKFDSDWLSPSRVIVSTSIQKKKKEKNNPRLGGLHLTCDTHFRTRLTYSSQKSCVKIWFGLVEIGSMLSFSRGGGRSPLLEGVTWDLRCPFSYTAELFQSKVMCENLVRIGWAFQELSW